MDIRCENCNTEYELSEDRLKPEGVTVKCTSCGHIFKVRRQRRPAFNDAVTVQRSRRISSSDGERTWLVRVEDGEIMTCRELATLQEWIAEGEVTRAAEISRTGKKWKKLGDIPELASFFRVADEAGAAAGQTLRSDQWDAPTPVPSAHPRLLRVGSSGAARVAGDSAPDRSAVPEPVKRRDTARGTGPAPLRPNPSARPAASPAPEPPKQTPVAPSPAAESPMMSPRVDPMAHTAPSQALRDEPPAPASPPPAGPRLRLGPRDVGETGPTGGLARGVPTDDVAFAGGQIRPMRDGFGAGATDFRDSGSLDKPPRSRAALLIILGSLVVIAGALAVVFLYVFRTTGSPDTTAQGALADASPVVVAPTIDAATPGAANRDEILAAAHAAVYADVASDLIAAAENLAALPAADTDAGILALRSQIAASLAEKARRSDADGAKAEAVAQIEAARKLADAALAIDRRHPAALAAKADALRLDGERARVIERWIRKALREAPGNPEAKLVDAKLAVEQNRLREAEAMLRELAARGGGSEVTGDVRPIFWLAVLAAEDGNLAAATARADKVLAISPSHAGARVLLESSAPDVSGEDPMPPQIEFEAPPEDTEDSGEPAIAELSYEERVRRADRAAESGNCNAASDLYESALEANPAGVEALTGLGYCLLDAREFSAAHAKFRAALGIAPRYQGALYGIAEAYQQQGDVSSAIDAYQRYLDKHPRGARADMAKRQIERLGGDSAAEPETPEDPAAPVPEDEPAPAAPIDERATDPTDPGSIPQDDPSPASTTPSGIDI